jgi:hypothetical protein
VIKQDVEDGQPFHYKYLYGEIDSDKKPEVPQGYLIVETVPWGLKKWYRKVVSRDRGWYKSTVVWQDAFWSDVALAKAGKPYSVQDVETVPASVKQSKDRCLITDS